MITTTHEAHRAVPWLRWVARGGMVAQGIIYLLIGGLALAGAFLIRAAWRHDPLDATGMSGALQSIRHQPWGAWLLGSVAVGLIAFGLAQLAKARYHLIRRD